MFGVNLLDSFLQGLTAKQENRLIWAPDMIGCTMFLISGHLALQRFRARRLRSGCAASSAGGSPRSTSSAPTCSSSRALAAFIDPETSSAVNEALANWGTFGGALCFAVGGVLQLFDSRPASSP